MTDSLGDLLARKDLGEPTEVLVIKTFMQQNYQASCQVSFQGSQIIITVRGAALAGTLRMRLHELQALCQTDKRLVIRIQG